MDNSSESNKLNRFLENVGDMALKRRARKILDGLDLCGKNKIIDLGCGDGFYLYLLNNLYPELNLTGFDHDQIVLKNARKNIKTNRIKLIKGNISKMPFKKNSFQKAIITEVLEHIDDDKQALDEIYRILKPGGVLVLTVPSYSFPFLWDPVNWILQNIFNTHICGIGFFAGIWARHKRLYKKFDIEELIREAGFKIERVEQLTTRCLPFNHYLVNLVARLIYDFKLPTSIKDPISKFKQAKKPLLVKIAFYVVNLFDKLNDVMPGNNGLSIYIKAIK